MRGSADEQAGGGKATGSGTQGAERDGPVGRRDAEEFDVVVVGGGNAGFCAAHAAAECGGRVLLLEKGPLGKDGGNSYYTAGAFRIAHGGLPDVEPLVEPDPRNASAVLAPYTEADYRSDMLRVTDGRCDPELTDALVSGGREVLGWLTGLGIRFRLMYERQAYPDGDGRQVFFGGLALGTVDGGKGLIAAHRAVAERLGVEVRYGCGMTELVLEGGTVAGLRYRPAGGTGDPAPEVTVRAGSVVLAAGGFQANPELRARYLGPGWELARVRGNPLNTGEVLLAAIDAGADRAGDWSSCHSVAWDAASPPNGGDRELTNRLTRQSYPIGLVVNRDGIRFVDEGADFRNYTYAKYGAEILRQPGAMAYQLFDAATRPLLRTEEYDSPGASQATADSLEELAGRLGIDAAGLTRTIKEFNAAVDRETPFSPAIKDGKAARDIDPPKSNWAVPLERPPFYAYPVTCGITFTFGGVRIDRDARVLRPDGTPIPGLFAAGELVGGLFSGNYLGGAGLTAGALFGQRAGRAAGGR
jgi:tricarballylate dehydrogenase